MKWKNTKQSLLARIWLNVAQIRLNHNKTKMPEQNGLKKLGCIIKIANKFVAFLLSSCSLVDCVLPNDFGSMEKTSDSGGIRTHAFEKTGALNQRLRPLGHAIGKNKKIGKILHVL